MNVERIELSIEHARELVAKGQKALKLAENSDFRELVLEGYFKDEAARLVRFYSDGTLDAETRGHMERDMHGIGAFQRFMQRIVKIGEQAEADLENALEQLQEARMEQEDDLGMSNVVSEYNGTLGA